MTPRTALLFPGLGAYSAGMLRGLASEHPQVAATFREIDSAAARHGIPPVSQVVVEALDDGVHLVCAKAKALKESDGKGAMAAIGANETVTRRLIGALDDPDLLVACLNAPRQTVISGPHEAIDRAGNATAALDSFFAKLQLPYASHHPAARRAMLDFRDLIAGTAQHPLSIPVFSPVQGHRYADTDDIKAGLNRAVVPAARAPVEQPDRTSILARLRGLHATALEYPEEVLAEDALLEAQLGIDSLKQTALLAKVVVAEFGLADEVSSLRAWDFPSLGRVADHILRAPAASRP
ncbi:acyltransferase domain-containing protein [Actinocrispum sp. NPDC049592]|uniref:acyltransferase domain-containing protein n=1 Tax=Actinocrispum sp. NPDC049592 TaxID=3154835 RepID=UPI00343ED658